MRLNGCNKNQTMKRLLPFLTLLFAACTFSASAQTHRVFMNMTCGTRATNELWGLNGPQVGYAWQSGSGKWHEVELGRVSVTTEDKISRIVRTEELRLRYQYAFPLFARQS